MGLNVSNSGPFNPVEFVSNAKYLVIDNGASKITSAAPALAKQILLSEASEEKVNTVAASMVRSGISAIASGQYNNHILFGSAVLAIGFIAYNILFAKGKEVTFDECLHCSNHSEVEHDHSESTEERVDLAPLITTEEAPKKTTLEEFSKKEKSTKGDYRGARKIPVSKLA